jgi:hypothetical protein
VSADGGGVSRSLEPLCDVGRCVSGRGVSLSLERMCDAGRLGGMSRSQVHCGRSAFACDTRPSPRRLAAVSLYAGAGSYRLVVSAVLSFASTPVSQSLVAFTKRASQWCADTVKTAWFLFLAPFEFSYGVHMARSHHPQMCIRPAQSNDMLY